MAAGGKAIHQADLVLPVVYMAGKMGAATDNGNPGGEFSCWRIFDVSRSEVLGDLDRAVPRRECLGDQVVRDGMDLAFATGMLLNDVIAAQMPRDGLLKHDVNKTQTVKDAIEFEIAESPPIWGNAGDAENYRTEVPITDGQANESAPCPCATCVTSRSTQHDIDKASKLLDSTHVKAARKLWPTRTT